MTSLTDTQVVTASGGLVELAQRSIPNSAITYPHTSGFDATSASFATPITLTFVSDGSPVLVELWSRGQTAGGAGAGTSSESYVTLFLDGVFQQRMTRVQTYTTYGVAQSVKGEARLTPSAGSHTIELKQFRVNADGAIDGGGSFLRVSKIVQATQWPAVTTGTIICTSSTRPSAPFEGQKIYETDTDRELTYDATAWVQTNSLGGWSTWTPQLYQNGNLTGTIQHARYTRIGDTAIVQGRVNATQAGTAGQQIEIRNLPYSAEAAGDYVVIGNAVYWDGTLRWLLHVETLPTATSIAFGYDSAPFAAYGGGRFGEAPSKAVASGHFISFATTYEIA